MKADLLQSVRKVAIDIQHSTQRNPESRVSFFEGEPLGKDSQTESAELNEQQAKIRSVIEGLAESDVQIRVDCSCNCRIITDRFYLRHAAQWFARFKSN